MTVAALSSSHLSKPLDLVAALEVFEHTYMASRNLAPRTRQEYRNDISYLIDFLVTQCVVTYPDRVERRHLESYLAHLDGRGFKGSTRRRKVAAIRSFFGFLHEHGVVGLSPAAKLIPPAREQPEPRVLSKPEYTRLLDAVRYHPRDAAIIELLLQTGIRLSELTRLSIQDLQLPAKPSRDPQNAGSATITGKGRKTRTVTLNYKACQAIRSYLTVRDDAEMDRLFLSKYRNAITNRAVQKLVAKYLVQAGIFNASVHSLRHTFATHHVRQRTGLRTVQQALGHASLKTTEIYVHLARDQMDQELQEHAL